MITKGNRRGGQPFLIQDNTATSLHRINLGEGSFNESWIQKMIYENPGMLPISDIDTGFSPLIAIGREVSTKAGNIDNLFVSTEGYLTIVETKLWRNPEARREVVGQIIDYAKELSKWSFTDLDNSVRSFNRLYHNHSDGLINTVRKHEDFEDTDEQTFIDNISRNLKRGRFLLLIVGDGIRESVEDMIDYLSQYPQLYFTLALVELQVFTFEKLDNARIIIPQLVTRTKEITRAIVRVEGTQTADVKINIETDLGLEITRSQGSSYERLTIIAQDYFEQLQQNTDKETVEFVNQVIKDCEELGLIIEWNSSSFTAKLPDPNGSGIRIAIFSVDRRGLIAMGLSRGQFKKLDLPYEMNHIFSADTAAMLPGVTQHPIKKLRWSRYVTLTELKPVYHSFIGRVKEYLNDIIIEGRKVAAELKQI